MTENFPAATGGYVVHIWTENYNIMWQNMEQDTFKLIEYGTGWAESRTDIVFLYNK